MVCEGLVVPGGRLQLALVEASLAKVLGASDVVGGDDEGSSKLGLTELSCSTRKSGVHVGTSLPGKLAALLLPVGGHGRRCLRFRR